MKLSVINGHHQDPNTDQLYQPLRTALNNPFEPNSPKILKTQLKHSFLPSKNESHFLKSSTFIPQNVRLIETNNPLKRMRVRSKSYKAISVQQVVKKPLNDILFHEQLRVRPAKTKQIVYDYDPNEYNSHQKQFNGMILPQGVPTRTRSATTIGTMTWLNPRQRIQSNGMTVQRQIPEIYSGKTCEKVPSNNINNINNNPSKSTSIKVIPHTISQGNIPAHLIQVKPHRQQTIPDFSSEYFQHCNKYIFHRGIKDHSKKQHPRHNALMTPIGPETRDDRSRSGSNYKYNLFSMLDQQTNLKCQTGFCTKNQVVAPKIRKKW